MITYILTPNAIVLIEFNSLVRWMAKEYNCQENDIRTNFAKYDTALIKNFKMRFFAGSVFSTGKDPSQYIKILDDKDATFSRAYVISPAIVDSANARMKELEREIG